MTTKQRFKNTSISFLSLRGRSGILVGLYGLTGCYFIQFLLKNYSNGDSWVGFLPITYLEYLIMLVAGLMIFLALLTSFRGAKRRAKKSDQVFWNSATRKNLLLFSIPLILGFFLCLYLYTIGNIMWTPGVTLISYGLACMLLSYRLTGPYLVFGLLQLLLGVLALNLIKYTVLLWGVGFGVLHLIYGIRYK